MIFHYPFRIHLVAIILLLMTSFCVSCAPEALPRERPEKEFGDSLSRAEKAAQLAEKAATETGKELVRSNEMLEEARALTIRAESAEARCRQAEARRLEAERAREKARRAQLVKAKEQAAVVVEASPTPSPEATKSKEVEYSPSDAPLEK